MKFKISPRVGHDFLLSPQFSGFSPEELIEQAIQELADHEITSPGYGGRENGKWQEFDCDISDNLKAVLKTWADQLGCSQNELLNLALKQRLRNRRKKEGYKIPAGFTTKRSEPDYDAIQTASTPTPGEIHDSTSCTRREVESEAAEDASGDVLNEMRCSKNGKASFATDGIDELGDNEAAEIGKERYAAGTEFEQEYRVRPSFLSYLKLWVLIVFACCGPVVRVMAMTSIHPENAIAGFMVLPIPFLFDWPLAIGATDAGYSFWPSLAVLMSLSAVQVWVLFGPVDRYRHGYQGSFAQEYMPKGDLQVLFRKAVAAFLLASLIIENLQFRIGVNWLLIYYCVNDGILARNNGFIDYYAGLVAIAAVSFVLIIAGQPVAYLVFLLNLFMGVAMLVADEIRFIDEDEEKKIIPRKRWRHRMS